MLFVPWVSQELEAKYIPATHFARLTEQQERTLLLHLLSSHDVDGTFGKRAGEHVKRLPASVYWSGLKQWGIRQVSLSQDEYYQHVDEIYIRLDVNVAWESAEREREDDLDTDRLKIALIWHSGLPFLPDNFPHDASFDLTREEASFLRDRIMKSCPGSLMAHLSR